MLETSCAEEIDKGNSRQNFSLQTAILLALGISGIVLTRDILTMYSSVSPIHLFALK